MIENDIIFCSDLVLNEKEVESERRKIEKERKKRDIIENVYRYSSGK